MKARLAVLLFAALLACQAGRPAPATRAGPATRAAPAAERHTRCGWIAARHEDGVRTFVAHAAFFDAIHPKWFELGPDGSVVPLPGVDDERVLAAARAHGVELSPLVASVRDPAPLRAVLGDPARRAAHVRDLVEVAVSRGYAGLDIDYEHLWGAADRSAVEALVDELAVAMRAAGKRLSLAVPGQTEVKRGTVWRYTFLAERVERVHIMGYDLHTVGTHAGPVAPQGWVEAVVAHAAATGRPERFVLGLPNYGVTTTWSAGSRKAAARCGERYRVTDEHMAGCPKGRFEPGRTPNCETDQGRLYFDDLVSLEDKVRAAKRAGLGGISYWRLGDEPDGFFAMITRHFP